MTTERLVDSPDGGDPLGFLVGFAEALRAAGFLIGVDRMSVAAEALANWGVAAGAEPYWPLRVAFCSSEADLLRFDGLYQLHFRRPPPSDAGSAAPEPVLIPTQSRGVDDDNADASRDAQDQGASAGAGNTAQLAARDFDDMTAQELLQVSTWVELLRPVPARHTMRQRPDRSGRIDPARTIRLMLRHHGELLRIRFRRPASRPRRVLLLVDVSASMRPYSDVLLRFAHAALSANPRNTEVFAVGTRHTRLTGPLSARRPQAALPAAGRVETDWSGGTTLGIALRDFLHQWGGSIAVRSATVVLASDGFEFRDPTLLVAQVARLGALAHALIWADPSHRTDGDRPVDDHVADAQAQVTVVTGCQSYDALRELAKVITNA